ncbi:MAG: hypothetical protein MK364_16935, partial [Pirellulales bacterium]|nr:hypothetical protein [Pirellulales bacterium]
MRGQNGLRPPVKANGGLRHRILPPLGATVFGHLQITRRSNHLGVSVRVRKTVHPNATGQQVPCAVNEDFTYPDAGRVECVIEHPAHTRYEIRFRTAETAAGPHTNDRGGRDLLRYDTGKPCPIALICLSRLIDLPGDGKRDLVGCW